jgi:serine/threonine protein kinase
MAPEMYEEGDYDFKVDVFSFGLILYEIFTNKAVFGGDLSPPQIMNRALTGKRPRVPDNISGFARTLIESCWSTEPQSRPSFCDILDTLRQHDYKITRDVNSSAVRMDVKRFEADID